VLVVRADWHEAVRSLGLLEPGGLERWLAAAPSGGSGRAATARIAIPGGPQLVVRRLRHGGLLAPLLRDRYASPARVLRELDATARLRAAGAPVPEPVLALGRRRGIGFSLALATVYEEGAVDALAFLASEPEDERLLRAAAAVGAALRRFHDAGGRHPDLHVKNLLLRETRAGADALVIDLDRARMGAAPGPAERAAEIGRLGRSLLKRRVSEQVGERGAAAFLTAYCAGDRALRDALVGRFPAERRKAWLHALHYAGTFSRATSPRRRKQAAPEEGPPRA
jgi:3-deoxy-D-manno-octulosonic acid kinase